MSSLLSMLQAKPAPFYEKKLTPEEKGRKGGSVLRQRKLLRQQAQRARLKELLLRHMPVCRIAKELGISPMTTFGDIASDPELKKLASLYVKNGGWRGGRKQSIVIRKETQK